MAAVQPPQPRRRRAPRDPEEGRNVRARLDEHDNRLLYAENRLLNHETRLQYQEAPLRHVMRGFDCVQEFFRMLPNSFPQAKQAFIEQLLTELRNHCPPEVGGAIDELDYKLHIANGWALIGIYRTGGMMGDQIDGLIRFQPGLLGLECGGFLTTIGASLPAPRVLHQDRVSKPKGKGKGKGDEAEGGGQGEEREGQRETSWSPTQASCVSRGS